MKAVRLYGVHDLRIEDVPAPPAPVADQVLLQVEAAGICGSDLHNYHTGMWISRTPSIPGHEFCARVIKAGPAVSTLAPGDRVIADSRMPCGACTSCTSGKSFLCAAMGFVGEVNDGGFAPLTLQHEHQLLKLPDQAIAAEIAALAEPLAVGLHAANSLAPRPGERALIMGAGTIGAMAAIALGQHGVHDIAVADPNQTRQNLLCEAFNLHPFDTASAPQQSADQPVLCIDTTGAGAALGQALASLARGARIAIVGLYGKPVTIDMNIIVEGGMQVFGCAAFDTELHQAVSLLRPLRGQLQKLATSVISLDDVPAAYARLSAKDAPVLKAIITPGTAGTGP